MEPLNITPATVPLSFLPLPNELQMGILKQLNEKGIRQAAEVCKLWNDNMLNPEALKILDASKLSKLQFFVEWNRPRFTTDYQLKLKKLVEDTVLGSSSIFASHPDLTKNIINILKDFSKDSLENLEIAYKKNDQTPFSKVFKLTIAYQQIRIYVEKTFNIHHDASFILNLLNSKDYSKINLRVDPCLINKGIDLVKMNILRFATEETLKDERKFNNIIKAINYPSKCDGGYIPDISRHLKETLLMRLANSSSLNITQTNQLIESLIIILNKMSNEDDPIKLMCSEMTDTQIISMFANFCRLAHKEPDFLSACPNLKTLFELIKSIGTGIGNRAKKCAKENLSKDNLKLLKQNTPNDKENCVMM